MAFSPRLGGRVLVVDDTEAKRYTVVHSLRLAGMEVLEAATGQEALAAMERAPDMSGFGADGYIPQPIEPKHLVAQTWALVRMPLERSANDLVLLCREVLDEFSVTHPAHDIRFEGDASCEGYWDGTRMRQVVSNEGEPITGEAGTTFTVRVPRG